MGIFSGFLDLIYPPRCIFCRKFLQSSRSLICPDCMEQLPYTENGGEKTGDFFSACISPLYYEGNVRESLLRFKFKDATGYSKTYAKLLAPCIQENCAGKYDLISWVPLSKERLKERGYDQAMLLALDVALEMNDVAVSTLEKIRDTDKQSTLGDAVKRRANISGAYIVPDRELVEGKRILLIDDIVTTGSTLSECARMLLDSGAKDVICAAVAQTRG